MSLRHFFSDRRMFRLLLGTAGTWFLFDYAYYGNTLSLPVILKDVDSGASLVTKLALTLGIFVVFAVPGYALAVLRMDRIGHRRLQVIGFAAMAGLFFLLGAVAGLTTAVVPFVAVFGLSYFFMEFGPNTTTFVLPSEVFPVSVRTTGHGTAAGIGKLGAFVGVFLVPRLAAAIGLRGMLVMAGAASVAGLLLTFLLPEPARRGLDEVSAENSVLHALRGVDAEQAQPFGQHPGGEVGEDQPAPAGLFVRGLQDRAVLVEGGEGGGQVEEVGAELGGRTPLQGTDGPPRRSPAAPGPGPAPRGRRSSAGPPDRAPPPRPAGRSTGYGRGRTAGTARCCPRRPASGPSRRRSPGSGRWTGRRT